MRWSLWSSCVAPILRMLESEASGIVSNDTVEKHEKHMSLSQLLGHETMKRHHPSLPPRQDCFSLFHHKPDSWKKPEGCFFFFFLTADSCIDATSTCYVQENMELTCTYMPQLQKSAGMCVYTGTEWPTVCLWRFEM